MLYDRHCGEMYIQVKYDLYSSKAYTLVMKDNKVNI